MSIAILSRKSGDSHLFKLPNRLAVPVFPDWLADAFDFALTKEGDF